VMQSITARSNSFLRQTNNNVCYYRGRESNRAPLVGSPLDIMRKYTVGSLIKIDNKIMDE
jgi:hypothetical protein